MIQHIRRSRKHRKIKSFVRGVLRVWDIGAITERKIDRHTISLAEAFEEDWESVWLSLSSAMNSYKNTKKK